MTSMLYNNGTGLIDIEATSVTTVELVTETFNCPSGTLDCSGIALSNLGRINGVHLQQTSNAAYSGSNAAYNAAASIITQSNAVWPTVTATQELAAWDSNALVSNSNAIWPISTGTSNALFSAFAFSTSNTSNLKPTLQTRFVQSSNIVLNGSNLVNATNKIDYNSWISGGPTFSNDNSMALAGLTLGAAGLLSSLGGQLLNNAGQIGPSVANDIAKRLGEEALDETTDPTQSDSNIVIHWNNVVFPPVHKNLSSHDVAFSSNVHVNSNAKLYSIRSDDLVRVDGGRFKRIAATPARQVVIDFATRDFFGSNFTGHNVSASNSITTSNLLGQYGTFTNTLSTSNAYATNVSTNSITACNVSTQTLWLGAGGLYTQNPVTNPLTAIQVLDQFGNYKGTINASQVINTESLNFNALADGIMRLDSSFVNYTDPFSIASETPFFSI